MSEPAPEGPGLHRLPRRADVLCFDPVHEPSVMEHLARALVRSVRAAIPETGAHPGIAWLDSGGLTLTHESESVLTAFAWRHEQHDEAHGHLPATLNAFAPSEPEPVTSPAGPGEETTPRFRGGWIGFLGYEAAQAFEPIRLQTQSDLDVPVSSWRLFPVWYRLRAGSGRLEVWTRLDDDPEVGPLGPRPRHAQWSAWAEAAMESAENESGSPVHPAPTEALLDPLLRNSARSFTRDGFQRAVESVKHAVREGEVFQANLAHRLSVPTRSDPFEVYLTLRRLNPSPFMAYLEEDWGSIVSNSPERLFCVRAHGRRRRVEARPIAGTRPRGRTPQEEHHLREDLVTHPKERAEHTMLVDLVRNDLGRVCRPGTVRVAAFQQVETYSHVLHLVSRIEGELREATGVDALVRALFPGGTITGAPKLRSMEVIDRLERVARGPYTGSLGYINPDGTMDLNILIRTLTMQHGRAHAYAGAGIVAQSDPGAEFEETLHKAAAMLLALSTTPTPDETPNAVPLSNEPLAPPAFATVPVDLRPPGYAPSAWGAPEDEETLLAHAARRGRAGPAARGRA